MHLFGRYTVEQLIQTFQGNFGSYIASTGELTLELFNLRIVIDSVEHCIKLYRIVTVKGKINLVPLLKLNGESFTDN